MHDHVLRRSFRTAFLAGVSFSAIALGAGQARADMFNRRPIDPAVAAANAATASAAQSARAAAAAQKTIAAFQRAAMVRGTLDAAQAAARAAAAAAAAKIPDGLKPGGLEIGSGVATDPSQWVNANKPVETTSGGDTTVTIKQTGQNAILTWDSFNVGKNTTVYYDQSAGGKNVADWIALNRILDRHASASQIYGHIKAQGQVYLINTNGILFGGTASVDVHGLVASSLDFVGKTIAERNAAFQRGLLSVPNENNPYAVLSDGGDYGHFENGVFDPGTGSHLDGETFADGDGVTVAAGARIATDSLGRVVLAGHNAINEGTISSPNGQVVLAAGRQIFLAQNITPISNSYSQQVDPDLRGVTAGVDRGGKAGNIDGGIIETSRGNITITGKTVVQDGLLSADTGTSANGSIRLAAGDGVSDLFTGPYPAVGHYGTLTLTGKSEIDMLPDDAAGETPGNSQYRASKLELIGQTITLADGTSILAPAANASILASKGPNDPYGVDHSSLYIGKGVTIDLGGVRNVTRSVSENEIMAELRANELRDDPVQRNGPLRGRTIEFDLRYGSGIGDVSGYYDLIRYSASELMTGGGSLSLSGGSIIARKGSTIDVSGGAIGYTGGTIRTTQLVDSAGHVVDIADADPNAIYAGIYGDFTVTNPRFGITRNYYSAFFRPRGAYEGSYVEGRDAGSLTIVDPNFASDPTAFGYRILDGTVRGDVIVGENQRDAPTTGNQTDPTAVWHQRPRLAALTLGSAAAVNSTGSTGSSIVIAHGSEQLPDDFTAGDTPDDAFFNKVLLSDSLFDGNTFGRVNLRSGLFGGDITIAKGATVDLGAFGSISLIGTHVDIAGNIVSPSGSVTILTTDVVPPLTGLMPYADLPAALKPSTTISGTIDVAGRFINDVRNPAADSVLAIKGGSVFVGSAQDLIVTKSATIDVSGGGHLASNGKTLTAGASGAISLIDDLTFTGATGSSGNGQRDQAGDGTLAVAGILRGYGISQGGTLNIGTQGSILLTSVTAKGADYPITLVLTPDFLDRGGFQSFQLAGARGVTVAAGTVVRPRPLNVVLNANGIDVADGSRLGSGGAGTLAVLPDALRGPVSLTLANGARDSTGTLIITVNTGNSNSVSFDDQVVDPGTIAIGKGAVLDMGPGAAVALYSYQGIDIDGTIATPGGTIVADLRPQLDLNYALAPVPEGGFRITLGNDARLLATGYARTSLAGSNVVRSVYGGGSVVLGSTGIDTLDIAKGAVIDVSGVTGTADLIAPNAAGDPSQMRYVPVEVASAGGSIVLAGDNGVIAGTLRAAPGNASAAGGSISIVQTNFGTDNTGFLGPVVPGYPVLTVRQSIDGIDVDQARAANRLYASANRLNDSGADALVLRSSPTALPDFSYNDTILFDGPVSLSSRGFIGIYANTVGMTSATAPGAKVAISARNVEMGYAGIGQTSGGNKPSSSVVAPSRVDASLVVTADTIDLTGRLVLGCGIASCGGEAFDSNTGDPIDFGIEAVGFAHTQFVAKHDIRLNPLGGGGGITAFGDLSFDSAQTYITALGAGNATGDGFLIQSPTSVSFHGNGTPTVAPFSFGETITVRATDILQAGVLRAPLGHIVLNGTHSTVLAPGSLTSVSLDGQTALLGLAAQDTIPGYADPGSSPTKLITIGGPHVNVQKGATIDVSGGGDLYAYAFQPGNGGGSDILDAPGTYAIMPGYGDRAGPLVRTNDGSSFAAYDPSLGIGSSVYLSGVPGLAAGVYTLLPAHYALLPGAFSVRLQSSGLASLDPRVVGRTDGAYVTGGYRLDRTLPIRDTGFSRFVVTPGAVVRTYSSYLDYSFDTYAADLAAQNGFAIPELPADAGTLVLAATDTLKLNGTGLFTPGDKGRAGGVDIAASQIAIVGSGETAPDGYLALDTGQLNAFGAGSLLIGGTRSRTSKGEQIAVVATDLLVDDAGTTLSAPDIQLASLGSLKLADGASIVGTGTTPADDSAIAIDGDGAFVRVSASGRREIDRTDVTGASGLLDIGKHVSLTADGSLSLDGSQNVLIDNSATFKASELDLSSSRVSLGDAPAGAKGTELGATTLANLSAADDLLIRSASSIDLYDGTVLGGRTADGKATLKRLTFETGSINSAGGNASITTGTFAISNPLAAAGTAASSGSGTLSISADTLSLGDGAVTIGGFGRTDIAAGRLSGDGKGVLTVAGDLAARTDLLTASAGSDLSLIATGAATFSRLGGAAQPLPTDFGGRLKLAGASLLFDTAAALPAGVFELEATRGNLTLGDHAAISVAGRAVAFADTTKYADAGTVRLTSTGDITAAAGSMIDLSADAGGGDAGRLMVTSGGVASLGGGLKAAPAKGRGGQVAIDAGRLADFNQLNDRLAAAGFTEAELVRVRAGSLVLDGGKTIHAHRVGLRADTGTVTVDGTIDASGTSFDPDGGAIAIVGDAGVTIGANAQLLAREGKTAPGDFASHGGSATMEARGGRLDVAKGALIDVTGQTGGTVVFAAQRDGTDIAVDQLAGTIRGARDASLVGYRTYDTATVDATARDVALADAATWAGGTGAIAARLGTGATHIDGGIRFQFAGDLAVTTDIDLHDARYGGHAGALELVAAGDLKVDGSIGDGFSSIGRDGTLLAGPSWSIGLEAGRDLTIGAGRLVRTGTGTITLAAGRDFTLGDGLSAVYTAGAATPTVAGFDPVRSSDGRVVGDFPTDGGDLSLTAGRDIIAPVAHQFFSEWLYRYGVTDLGSSVLDARVGKQNSWSIVFANFEQGIGALGGGDVAVSAGRDIRDLAVALPTTGHQTTAPGAVVSDAGLVVRGGGNLSLDAGRDVLGGIYMLGKGRLDLRSGGMLGADRTSSQRLGADPSAGYAEQALNPLFALMDASADVRSRAGATIEAVLDPMLLGQTCGNIGCTTEQGTDEFGNPTTTTIRGIGSAFFSNTERTAFSVSSDAGDVLYEENPFAGVDLTQTTGEDREITMTASPANDPRLSLTSELVRMPGTIRMSALQGSWIGTSKVAPYSGGLLVSASDNGTIDIAAANDVRTASIVMEDVGADYRRGALTPLSTETTDWRTNNYFINLNGSVADNYQRGFTPSHIGDRDPVLLEARDGSICSATSVTQCIGGIGASFMTILLPKPLFLTAGLDVTNILVTSQNNSTTDVTRVQAGRDIRSTTTTLVGVGQVEYLAGRNIDQSGIVSAGNFANTGLASARNLALPADQGADIQMLAGIANGVDYDGFAADYLDPANAAGVVETYLAELRSYLASLGRAASSDAGAVAAFKALPLDQRRSFLFDVYFNELKQTGIDYTDPKSPRFQQYKRGFAAIARLFPGKADAASQGGSINLRGGSVETRAGGSVTLLAPYGYIDVGDRTSTESSSDGGVVTRAGGDIHIMADQSISLYTSRVFTLQGGDVTMWTSNGDITAGAGSKTAISFPPLTYLLDNAGVLTINSLGVQTGSGIGVLDAGGSVDRKRSRLDLIAPFGAVDAGDAGIRVIGDVNIAALRIVNANNIQASGNATGLPKTVAVNVSALTTASSAASAVSTEAERLAERARPKPIPAELPSIITGRVIGFGD